MLQAVGIVSEYNPFHNGHLYLLNQAKQGDWCRCFDCHYERKLAAAR
jgi:predicted nucleotidyltransferase